MVDLDSTIIDTCKSIINLHNKLNDKKIVYQENYTWNFAPMIKTKEELKELFKLFDHKDFYGDTLVVFDDVVRIINELSMQNRIIICSKHDTSRRPITTKWIYETFPCVDIVYTDTFDKSIGGKCDIVIDDKPEAFESVEADYKICYSYYQWNKDWSGLRVNNWLEISRFIKGLK